LAKQLPIYRPLTDVFTFQPHLFRAPFLPWETVKPKWKYS